MTNHDDEAESNDNAKWNNQMRVDVEWEIVVEYKSAT